MGWYTVLYFLVHLVNRLQVVCKLKVIFSSAFIVEGVMVSPGNERLRVCWLPLSSNWCCFLLLVTITTMGIDLAQETSYSALQWLELLQGLSLIPGATVDAASVKISMQMEIHYVSKAYANGEN